MKSVDGDSEPDVGDMCLVRCRERSWWVEYLGKLLAIGSKEMILEVANNKESAQASSGAKKTGSKTGEIHVPRDDGSNKECSC